MSDDDRGEDDGGARRDVPDDLLEGLTGAARAARIGLVGDVLEAGRPLDDVRRAAVAGRLALLPVETLLAGDPTLTTDELAVRGGVDPDLLGRILQAMGLPIPARDETVWGEGDVTMVRLLVELEEAGVGDDALVELARTLGETSARIGAAAIVGLGSALSREGDTELDLARRLVGATRPVDERLGDVLGLLVRAQSRAQLVEIALNDDLITTGGLAGASTVSIGFADVVGFTRMGEELGAEHLQDVASRLSSLAGRATADRGGSVRVVKTIGDAVMVSGGRPAELVDTLLTLQELVGEDDVFPRIRAGVATGEAVPRAGDWFGPPVNRASRACATARPGSVLADETTREQIPDDDALTWTAIGRVRLKGLGRVPLHRVRRRPTGDRR